MSNLSFEIDSELWELDIVQDMGWQLGYKITSITEVQEAYDLLKVLVEFIKLKETENDDKQN